MANNLNKGFLLFIEPKKLKTEPIIDYYTRKITGAFNHAIAHGGSNYFHGESPEFMEGVCTRGWHTCSCGACSSNADYLLKTSDQASLVMVHQKSQDFFTGKKIEFTPGLVVTNSLCIHYVACHRDEIPKETLDAILNLGFEEEDPTDEQIQFKSRHS